MRSNLASPGQRLIALIIDTVILSIVGGVLGVGSGQQILGIGAGFIVGAAYNWYFWTQQNGQTPGKMLVGIRVVKADGGKIGDVEAVIRYIGYYVNTFLLLLGWLWALVDDQRQGLHDKLAGTVVVKA